ncbi:shikimate dehydrogenase [uncultured Imperialibacter sp.]|uniref:shikimate dehydrogenase family protein n=1 Tax=uncultured Imperialibacter sp. TaxID=1672639 RepID=UPI0030DCEF7A|tara:strand:+ start:64486 stop:65238 length:753 start_codon:yes stop_codon:yes gene_type:complete
MPRLFGLIGFPLTHSFSRKYFSEKFLREGISDASYELYEMETAASFPALFAENPNLVGINVTIPHKKAVIPLLNKLDQSASRVGAVNVIRKERDGQLTGFNSDYIGFLRSLQSWAGDAIVGAKALVLGTGGAASAVRVALEDLKIEYLQVSRSAGNGVITYGDLKNDPTILESRKLIINTTPLGTYPDTGKCPEIDFERIGSGHLFYDLVYNPAETLFMKKGQEHGAKVKNGYDMLVLQAERAWEIWNQK